MNYLAHGIRFLDRPYFMAGTAVPDWLSVADRRVRMRSRRIEPLLEQWPPGTIEGDIARGILQHLNDDDWFHTTSAFLTVTGQMTAMFRETLRGESFLNGFLGHIVTELLIDAELSERHPDRLDLYYDNMSQVDPHVVERVINHCSRESTSRLARFIPLFISEGFLYDYRDAEKLHRRLNQVMNRVKLEQLPRSAIAVLEAGRTIVSVQMDGLLPSGHFTWPHTTETASDRGTETASDRGADREPVRPASSNDIP